MSKTHTDQGNVGEAIAIGKLTLLGYAVSIPLQNNLSYDLVADKGGVLSKIQVKTTSSKKKTGWNVYVATSGGNTRQNTIKRFDNSGCDFVFVVTDTHRCWMIPSASITAGNYITVGNINYAEYEIK